MSKRERDKGRKGEAEVAAIYRRHGLDVRGLEGSGDHLIVCEPSTGLVIHSEVKRQETARVWAWWEQASSETEAGASTAVAFRRNRSPWLTLTTTEAHAELLARLASALDELRHLREDAER
jgi:hypothetical protein